jgi:glutamate-1-semialdehyde 2,1-aminomutase
VTVEAWILLTAIAGVPAALIALRTVRVARTLPALALMPIVSRRLSTIVRGRVSTEDEMLAADGAAGRWVTQRRAGLDALARRLHDQNGETAAWADSIRERFSDLRFTDASRVPFPFLGVMRAKFNLCSVVTESRGPRLKNLDGEWTIDVSGSYGMNVCGFDRYKEWIDRGWARVRDLGPVLGPLHPVLAENVALLRQISGKEEVSFHMSGTEAVMAAVRMARFNTGRRLVVCFSGAYHGWWDGVQPGLGSERPVDDCLALKDMHPASLSAIRARAHEIAGVLVNPVQSFHPNAPPPNDAILLTSDIRKTEASTERYRAWLHRLRDVCTAAGVPLIFDEVYTGFRLAPGGAQEYFGVEADMVIYGKTVAGGTPIGVVCGSGALMRRFDPDRPMRIAYVVGTFSAHPLVMGAMREFLEWATSAEARDAYAAANARCAAWVQAANQRFADAGLPIRLMNLGTVWTVLFKEQSRFNWLLQYYLRAEGVTLSWVGTGRCLSSMDMTDADYDELTDKLTRAARAMKRDAWWLTLEQYPQKEKRMKVRLAREMAGSLVPRTVKTFYADVMQRKHDDHHASHNDWANQALHVVSSAVFVYCYFIIFSDLTRAMCWGLASLFVRQFGHAILEPACHDEEMLLLGYTTREKTLIVLGYAIVPILDIFVAGGWRAASLDTIALHWFDWTVFVVALRVVYLAIKHDVRIAMIWFVKLLSDPITDLLSYVPSLARRATA